MKIYLSDNGQTIGPYSEKEVFSRIREGVIDESTPATTNPLGQWLPLTAILSSGFGTANVTQQPPEISVRESEILPAATSSDRVTNITQGSDFTQSPKKSPPPLPLRSFSMHAIDLNGKLFWCLYRSIRLTEISLNNHCIDFKDIESGTALNWFAGSCTTFVGAIIVASTIGNPNDFGAIIYMISISAILFLGGICGYAAATAYLRSVSKKKRTTNPSRPPRLTLQVECISKFSVDQQLKSFTFVVNDKVQYRFRYLDWGSFQPMRRELQNLGVVAQKA